jgi:hypothetical protein
LNAEGRYTALTASVQEAAMGRDPFDAMKIAARCIEQTASLHLPDGERPPAVDSFQPFPENGLRAYLQRWCEHNPKPVVLFLDEVDALRDDNFLAMLYQLRSGFTLREHGGFPQSMALIGLRDVRDYKIRIRPESESLGTGSPFNIKSKSLFMEGFSAAEVKAELFRLSQGQPWLTNALAAQIVHEILANDVSQPITLDLVQRAREELIERRDTHLDSLVDKLREPRVQAVVEAIINGTAPDFNVFDEQVNYCADLGLVTRSNPVRFANPIYQEIVPRVLSLGFQRNIPEDYSELAWYLRPAATGDQAGDSGGKRLDMDALLRAFVTFYRRHSDAWLERYDFREVGRQLLLMAFLQRIVNGGGRVEREMAVGRGRADLVIEFGPERFALELKLKTRADAEAKGRVQLARYLDRLGLEHGYLLLFETDPTIPWEDRLRWEELDEGNRRITLIGL